MNIWEYNYLEYLLSLNNKKKSLEKQLESYPQGWIVITNNKGYISTYLHTYNKGKRYVKYLSTTKDAAYIAQIEKRKKEAPLIKAQIKFYQRVIKRNLAEAKKIIDSCMLPEENFPPRPSQNPNHAEHLDVLTDRGEMVRSKSEKIIADILYKFNLDYRYEQRLNLDGIIFHPDFTVVNPLEWQDILYGTSGAG